MAGERIDGVRPGAEGVRTLTAAFACSAAAEHLLLT
jgi:hypothetical protein